MTKTTAPLDLYLTREEREFLAENAPDILEEHDALTKDLGTPDNVVDVSHIGPAYRAYWAGDSSLIQDLVREFDPILNSLAKRSATSDHDEAKAILMEAFLTVPRSLDPDNPGAIGFIIRHLRTKLTSALHEDKPVHVPHAMAEEYYALRSRYTVEGDQAQEWVDRARRACEEGTSGQARMSAATFMAVHHALATAVNRLSVHDVGKVDDETGADLCSFDIEDEDEGPSDYDTRDLVRHHLLPLLDEDERLVVLVTYGFADLVPEALDKVLVEKGVDLTDGRNLPLSSRTAAEVLGTNGYGLDKMGYMTVQRRLKSALAKMRTYLEEDTRRENA